MDHVDTVGEVVVPNKSLIKASHVSAATESVRQVQQGDGRERGCVGRGKDGGT